MKQHTPPYLRLIVTLCFFICFLTFPLSGKATEDVWTRVDSLKTLLPKQEDKAKLDIYNKILDMIGLIEDERTEKLYEEMIAEAHRQKNVVEEAYFRGEQVAYYSSYSSTDVYFPLTYNLIDFCIKNECWENYFSLYTGLVNDYILLNDAEKALEHAETMYAKAKELNDKVYLGLSHYSLGRAYQLMDRKEEAINALYQSIELMKGTIAHIPRLRDAYQYLISMLEETGRYKEMKPLLEDWEALIKSGITSENSQKPALFYLYGRYSSYYSAIKDFANAEIYLAEMDKIAVDYAPLRMQVEGYRFDYYKGKGDNEKAIETIDFLIEEIKNTGQEAALMFAYQEKARLLEKENRWKEALDNYQIYHQIKDSTQTVLLSSRIDEFRTQYEVDRHILEKERNRNYFLFSLGGCLLLILLLSIWIIYSRRLKKKNIGLVKQIQEQDRLDKELKEEHTKLKKLRQSLPEKEEEEPKDEQDKLFERLEYLMEEKMPYTNSSLNRKSLSEMLNTNEKYLRLTIEKNVKVTVSEYITLLRLKHAKDLLLLPSEEYTIEAISIDSGFGSRSSFHALFRNHYGLTPDEFRKIARKQLTN
ncbi:AraC family transcriptional regulator [Bacteroidales bacterium OttesenSCG-928-A17]|nr:AraC family transcriptional regulator [Bacteroidales bacterium OttesenSCG-928-A17]